MMSTHRTTVTHLRSREQRWWVHTEPRSHNWGAESSNDEYTQNHGHTPEEQRCNDEYTQNHGQRPEEQRAAMMSTHRTMIIHMRSYNWVIQNVSLSCKFPKTKTQWVNKPTELDFFVVQQICCSSSHLLDMMQYDVWTMLDVSTSELSHFTWNEHEILSS